MRKVLATILAVLTSVSTALSQSQQGPSDPPPCEQNQQRICATLTYQNKAVVATTTPATLPDQLPMAQTEVPHVDIKDTGSVSQLGEEQVRDSQHGANAFAPVAFATQSQMLNTSELHAIVSDPKLQRNAAILVGGGLAATAGAIGLAGSGLATVALTVLRNVWATYFFPIMYHITMSTCDLCNVGGGGGTATETVERMVEDSGATKNLSGQALETEVLVKYLKRFGAEPVIQPSPSQTFRTIPESASTEAVTVMETLWRYQRGWRAVSAYDVESALREGDWEKVEEIRRAESQMMADEEFLNFWLQAQGGRTQ